MRGPKKLIPLSDDINLDNVEYTMSDQDQELQNRIKEAIRNPKNMGELEDADSVGTVGNTECGEMLRMWVKYKDEDGKKVIDKASFQSFGCETAIAVASMATEMIQGKTKEEVLAMKGQELAADLGALPPMKIHCAELVEGALKSALESNSEKDCSGEQAKAEPGDHLLGKMSESQRADDVKIVFLSPDAE
jgi:nitrogen fixation NifU-like protein